MLGWTSGCGLEELVLVGLLWTGTFWAGQVYVGRGWSGFGSIDRVRQVQARLGRFVWGSAGAGCGLAG